MKNNRLLITAGLFVLLLVLLSCNLPTKDMNPQVSQSDAGTVQPSSPEENTSTDLDFSSARLSLNDLPSGFQELSADELAQLGINTDTLLQGFSQILSKAEPQNFQAFASTAGGDFEVIMSITYAPLTLIERGAADIFLKNPEQAIQQLAGNAPNTEVTVLSNVETIGDSSAAASFISQANLFNIQGELILSRRKAALQAAFAFYLEGSQPLISAADIARIMDPRLDAAQP